MSIGKRIGYILPGVAILEGENGPVSACVACGHSLGAASGDWKAQAVRREVPLAEAGGKAFDTGFEGVVLRHFYCPGCATLLDTETATPQDPVLTDRLAANE